MYVALHTAKQCAIFHTRKKQRRKKEKKQCIVLSISYLFDVSVGGLTLARHLMFKNWDTLRQKLMDLIAPIIQIKNGDRFRKKICLFGLLNRV